MKKAQILSALALAFALGVAVIPAANTYAIVVNDKGVEIEDNSTVTALSEAIDKAKETKSSEDFTKYQGLVDAINSETLESVKDTQKGNLLKELEKVKGFDRSKWEDSTYAQVLAKAKAELKNITDLKPATTTPEEPGDEGDEGEEGEDAGTPVTLAQETTTGVYTSLKNAITTAETAVEDAEADAIDAIQTILQRDFGYKGSYMTNEGNFIVTNDDDTKTVDFDAAVAYAKKQAPEYAFYENLVKAYNYANEVLEGEDKYTLAQATVALNNLNAAIAGKIVTTPGVGDGANNSDDNKAPNTGILSDAEGSASTTVAMVAGIATALTAAGAGVVAYRNARRSTRK